jgi:predicted RNA-binding protein associated with RNAse of E/G family
VTLPDNVTIHYNRPPGRSDTFVQRLVYERADVVVTFLERTPLREPVLVGGQAVLENGSPVVWFTFPGLWHDVGRFHLPDGTFTGIYANVLTPVRFDSAREWHTTDLFVDVWLPAAEEEATRGSVGAQRSRDRRAEIPTASLLSPQLLDEDELAHAAESGWIDETLAARARTEASWLLERAADGTWPPAVVSEWPLDRVLQHLVGSGTSPVWQV